MKAREEMPLLRCALGPYGPPLRGRGHSATASGTGGRKAIITRNWDMAGSTLKKPIRGRRMGVGAWGNIDEIFLPERPAGVKGHGDFMRLPFLP